jgi:hypothetical protein
MSPPPSPIKLWSLLPLSLFRFFDLVLSLPQHTPAFVATKSLIVARGDEKTFASI